MLKKRATSGASSTPTAVRTTTSAMLSVNAVWMRSVKPRSCSYWTVAFIPRSLPSSTNARNTVTAATAPNSDGTSSRARTSIDTNVTAFAITNVTVAQAMPRRSDWPHPSQLTPAPRRRSRRLPGGGDGAARRGTELLFVEGAQPLGPARRREVVLVAPAAALAEPAPQGFVGEQPVELFGELVRPRRRVEQDAPLAVDHDLGNPADARGEHGHAGRAGF